MPFQERHGRATLFEIEHYDSVREVQATTLDRVLDEAGVDPVQLLKLEAEGAEPEVLAGASAHLSRIDYIAADLGPERGVSQEAMAPAVIAGQRGSWGITGWLLVSGEAGGAAGVSAEIRHCGNPIEESPRLSRQSMRNGDLTATLAAGEYDGRRIRL